jgi:hypothetical protein
MRIRLVSASSGPFQGSLKHDLMEWKSLGAFLARQNRLI